jgi:hypothetical protein
MNSHGSRIDFMQPEKNEIINRGKPRMTIIHKLINIYAVEFDFSYVHSMFDSFEQQNVFVLQSQWL